MGYIDSCMEILHTFGNNNSNRGTCYSIIGIRICNENIIMFCFYIVLETIILGLGLVKGILYGFGRDFERILVT